MNLYLSIRRKGKIEGTIMADRRSLKFLGLIFATVTLAVMSATGVVVKGYADGAYSLQSDAPTLQ